MAANEFDVDGEGFLNHLEDWNDTVAAQLAAADHITLTDAHWEIIQLTRRYYQTYRLSPAMRPLVKYLRMELGPEKGNSLYLLSLFPDSPAKRISRIAGLPKPDNCL